jgi:SAM-dependent methyltransferase
MSAEDREKWNAKYAVEIPPREPSLVLVGLADKLPQRGLALDVAGGGGRHAIWLAQRGLDATLADISAAALAIARQRAREAGVPIQIVETDVEESGLPRGPWDLIVSVCFLHRPLYAEYPAALAVGGMLAIVQPTHRNLERHAKPPRDYLLADGELPSLVSGLEVVYYEEGWLADDRHDAVIVARRR